MNAAPWKTENRGKLSIVLNGCLALETYIVSRPISNSSQLNISNKGRIEIEDAVIFISPTNYIKVKDGLEWFPMIPVTHDVPSESQGYQMRYYMDSDKKKPGFFILEIFFAVKTKPIVFHPGDVVLRYRDKSWRPVNTYELVKMNDSTNPLWGHSPINPLCAGKGQDRHKRHYWHNPIAITDDTGVARKLRGMGVPESIKLEQDTNQCFALEFPINPPNPKEEFNVEIPSIQINNREIPIKIKYVPGTVKEKHA